MLSKDKLSHLLRLMYRIRFFETRIKDFYDYRSYLKKDDTAGDDYDFVSKGLIAGAVHLSIGQEATEVGICACLEQEDYVTSTHRGHGHAIAKGAELRGMMAELMGRATGYSRGCGGSMHIFSAELGLLGGNGIIGAQIPLAAGAAFSAKYRGTTNVAVGFMSDGAANQGTFHEALNMASKWDLPALFVVENNLYAASTPAAITFPITDIADRASSYGMPGVVVDGQDLFAVYDVAREAVDRARSGGGPTLIESKTFRFEGHCGNSRQHNNPEELEVWKQRDPITLFERRLAEDGALTPEEQGAVKEEVLAEVEDAVEFSKGSPFPKPEEMPVEF